MTHPSARAARIGGHAIRVADAQPTFWDKAEQGRWEPETLAAIRIQLRACAQAPVMFLDIGAWVGPTSLFAAAEDADVIAVEADPAALSQCRANLSANPALAARITIVDKALSASGGNVRMGAERKPGDSMSSLLLAQTSANTWDTPSIKPAELAGLLPQHVATLVKLDIEGGEYELLPAMEPVLVRANLGAIISFHPAALRRHRNGDEDSVRAATQNAIDALAGWQAYPLTKNGPAEEPLPGHAIRDALLSETSSETWLFRRI